MSNASGTQDPLFGLYDDIKRGAVDADSVLGTLMLRARMVAQGETFNAMPTPITPAQLSEIEAFSKNGTVRTYDGPGWGATASRFAARWSGDAVLREQSDGNAVLNGLTGQPTVQPAQSLPSTTLDVAPPLSGNLRESGVPSGQGVSAGNVLAAGALRAASFVGIPQGDETSDPNDCTRWDFSMRTVRCAFKQTGFLVVGLIALILGGYVMLRGD